MLTWVAGLLNPDELSSRTFCLVTLGYLYLHIDLWKWVLIILSWRVTDENIFFVTSSSDILFNNCACFHHALMPPYQSDLKGSRFISASSKPSPVFVLKSRGFLHGGDFFRMFSLSTEALPNPPESKTGHILVCFAGRAFSLHTQRSFEVSLILRFLPVEIKTQK